MSYLITLGLVETIFDPVVDRVKMVLVGATIIKRERVPIEVRNKLVVFDVDDGVDVDYCAGVGAGTGQQEGATSCRRCCGFLCEKCKKLDKSLALIYKN